MTLAPGDRLIDYSYARPDLAAAVKNGAKGILRYSAGAASDPNNPSHSMNAGKLITPAEFKAILAAGLDIIANDEWYETRVTEGAAAGKADGLASATLWKQCGLAHGAAIYPSWDAAPDPSHWPAVDAYLKAFAAEIHTVGGYVLGAYAGTPYLYHVQQSGLTRFGWRPEAGSWSSDGLPFKPATGTAAQRAGLVQEALKVTPAHLWQTGNSWFNNSADEDLVLRVPLGSHLEASAVVTKPAPSPTPAPAPAPTVPPGPRHILSPDGTWELRVNNDGRVALRHKGQHERWL